MSAIICRICLDSNVKMHEIASSEVQDVYEKLTSKKVQEDGGLYFACYICYWQLKKCQQLVIKAQKSKELLQQNFLNVPEQNVEPVNIANRMAHCRQNTLVVTKTEVYQIPEHYHDIIKTENQDERDFYEVMIKVEPDDDCAPPNKKAKLDATHNVIQYEDKFMEVNQGTITGTQTYTVANENKSSQILCDGKSQQILVKNDMKPFICNDCGKACDTEALLIKHISEHKPVIIQPHETYIEIQLEKAFKCQYCNYTSTRKNELNRHIKTHTGEKSFKCEYCNYTSTRKNELNRHIKTHTGEKSFKCEYCDYTGIRKNDLIRHIRTHTGEKHFKCQYCDYTCTRKNSLETHIRKHTGEKPYKCEYCNYTCASSSTLMPHIRTHTGEKPYKCQYCNYTCTRKNSLETHIRKHTGEKPYKCEYCNYTCTSSSTLMPHIRTHTGEKPYKCQHCDYTSIRSRTLKLHIRNHTGEKPFKCQYCNYTCTRNDVLKAHIRTHTGE